MESLALLRHDVITGTKLEELIADPDLCLTTKVSQKRNNLGRPSASATTPKPARLAKAVKSLKAVKGTRRAKLRFQQSMTDSTGLGERHAHPAQLTRPPNQLHPAAGTFATSTTAQHHPPASVPPRAAANVIDLAQSSDEDSGLAPANASSAPRRSLGSPASGARRTNAGDFPPAPMQVSSTLVRAVPAKPRRAAAGDEHMHEDLPIDQSRKRDEVEAAGVEGSGDDEDGDAMEEDRSEELDDERESDCEREAEGL